MRITGNKGEFKEGIDFVKFVVCGRLYRSNKRFSHTYDGTYQGYQTAMMINLWRGSVWGVKEDGKRKLIQRVIN